MKKHLILFASGLLLLSGIACTSNTRSLAAGLTITESTSVNDSLPELFTNSYSVSGDTITVSAKNGSEIGTVLNDALKAARDLADSNGHIITVNVPAGSYTQDIALHIYSNTTLNLTGVSIKCTADTPINMITTGTNGAYKGQNNYNTSSLCSGYNGFKNITINGGTFISIPSNDSTIVRLSHATNVHVNGITLKGGGCLHQMEVAAINGFYVTGCTFQDNGKATDINNHENQEALQLDIPCREFVFPNIYEDGTPMKNVEITGCTFKNVARGLGSHTMLIGAYHENIKINNNTFDNVLEECIIGLNYYNCEIKNNTIKNCGGGILVQNYKAAANTINTSILDGKNKYKASFRYKLNTVISGNNISLRYSPSCITPEGIKVSGYKQESGKKGGDGFILPAGNYYISGITVSDNTIYTSGHGIHFLDAHGCSAYDNTIIGQNFSSKDPSKNDHDGILVEMDSKNIVINNNHISGMTRNGILVQKSSSVKGISKNIFSKCGGRGIQIYDKSQCTEGISDNQIKSCKRGGIFISNNCTSGNITGNKISSYNEEGGISVYNNCTTGKIANNTITDTRKNGKHTNLAGIKISLKSTTGSMTGNKILAGAAKYSSNRGIVLYNSSKVKGSINKNTIEKCSDSAIVVSLKSKVTGSVNGNKISSAAKYGIQTLNKSSIGKAIASNTIKNAKTSGILIGSISNTLKIEKNKISGCSNAGIYIQPATTKYKITATNNTITGNKKGSGFTIRKANILINKNKISKVTFGVYADKKCKGNVYANKISKVTKKKVYTDTKKVKLKK